MVVAAASSGPFTGRQAVNPSPGMRSWESALSVLEALCERGQAAGHGWTLDTEFVPPHQQHMSSLENQGLVELAGREDRAELSALEGRPMRWAAA